MEKLLDSGSYDTKHNGCDADFRDQAQQLLDRTYQSFGLADGLTGGIPTAEFTLPLSERSMASSFGVASWLARLAGDYALCICGGRINADEDSGVTLQLVICWTKDATEENMAALANGCPEDDGSEQVH